MVNVLLLLPTQGLYEVYDEQGIALIASYLRENGYCVFMNTVRELSDLENMNIANMDIIGVTSYHENLPFVFEICKKVKEINRKVLTCLGGYSATYYAYEIMDSCAFVDVIIEREGEITFLEICKKIERKEKLNKQKGIYYRNENGKIIYGGINQIIGDLSDMPFSAKDIFEKNKMSLVELSTSRGCFNNCSFCYSHSYFDPEGKIRWRGRSAQNVFDEICSIVQKYKINKFYFNNASFEDSLPYKMFMLELCDKLIEGNINISFCANFRAGFYKHCSEKEIEKLINAGLTGVFLGIESFSEKDLLLYNKHASVRDNLNAIDFFRKYQIGLDIGFINFNPYSTYASLYENMVGLYKSKYLSSLVFMNRLRGYKGTPLYQKIENDGLLIKENYLNYYCYKYEDQNVEKFVDFIVNLFVNEPGDISGDSYYFSMYQDQLISHLKRVFRNNEMLLKLVSIYDEERRKILNEANEFCFVWYGELLNLLKEGWDLEKAKDIVKSIEIGMRMGKYVMKLKKNFSKFTKEVLAIDRTAIFYIK